jgi:hypothetical protein
VGGKIKEVDNDYSDSIETHQVDAEE